MENATKRKKKVILDKDITYTDEDLEKKMDDPKTLKIQYNVVGRSLPGRSGKALENMAKGTFVKVLFLSKDKRWVAVESMKSSQKRWVPRSALTPFKEDIFNKPAAAKEESDDE